MATLLYNNATLCAGVRWLQMCECAAIAHIRKVSRLETPPTKATRNKSPTYSKKVVGCECRALLPFFVRFEGMFVWLCYIRGLTLCYRGRFVLL